MSDKVKVRLEDGTEVEGVLVSGLHASAVAYIAARVECLQTAKPFGTITAGASPVTTIEYGSFLGVHAQAVENERRAWAAMSVAVLRSLGDMP